MRILKPLFITLAACAVAAIGSYVWFAIGDTNQKNWRDISVQPHGLVIALAVIVIALVYCLIRSQDWLSDRPATLGHLGVQTGLGTLGIALVAISMLPGQPPDPTAGLSIVPTEPSPSLPEAMSISIFFEHQSNNISAPQRSLLKNVFRSVNSCPGGSVELRGFASSAPFETSNEERNLGLAKSRALAVSDLAKGTSVHVTVKEWKDFREMKSSQGARDLKADGSRWPEREFLTRRVDVRIFEDRKCKPD